MKEFFHKLNLRLSFFGTTVLIYILLIIASFSQILLFLNEFEVIHKYRSKIFIGSKASIYTGSVYLSGELQGIDTNVPNCAGNVRSLYRLASVLKKFENPTYIDVGGFTTESLSLDRFNHLMNYFNYTGCKLINLSKLDLLTMTEYQNYLSQEIKVISTNIISNIPSINKVATLDLLFHNKSFYLNSFAFNSLYYQNMLLKDSLGRRVYLFDAYDKRNTLVFNLSTSCRECIDSLSLLNDNYDSLEQTFRVFIIIEGSTNDIFISKANKRFITYTIEEEDTMSIPKYPATYVMRPNRKIVFSYIGRIDEALDNIELWEGSYSSREPRKEIEK